MVGHLRQEGAGILDEALFSQVASGQCIWEQGSSGQAGHPLCGFSTKTGDVVLFLTECDNSDEENGYV